MNPGRGALGSLEQIHKDFQRRPETLTDNRQAHMTNKTGCHSALPIAATPATRRQDGPGVSTLLAMPAL
jgi:hypothetical protein